MSIAITRSLLVAALVAVSGCSVDIIHDVSEGEANAILATLHPRGIAAQKLRKTDGREPTYSISVPRSDAVSAWQILRAENLPRPRQQGLGEVFGKQGLVPTATQERALMHHALSGELARTLQSVDGVLSARVHVVLPERDPLAPTDAPTPAPKAAVLLRVHQRARLEREQVQQLVAGAVRDLSPRGVSVVVVQAHGAAAQADGAAAADASMAAPGSPLATVGPFRVALASRGLLRASLIGALGVIVALAALVLLVLRRNRALAAQLTLAEAQRPLSGGTGQALSVVSRAMTRTGHTSATEAGRDRS